jgi:allophanate hydrolase
VVEVGPVARLRETYRRIRERGDDGVWITLVPEDEAVARAEAAAGSGLPLAGRLFAVKDNIDVAGLPTTAACDACTDVPEATAVVVRHLLDAGAVLVGKTNLDQFATGLTGSRTSFTVPQSELTPGWISGGSSSGSAVAVAAGLVDFSLGTDTAGSGRIPAGCNGIVGLKPTKGLVSTTGLLPAMRSLDCITVFAPTVAEASTVLDVLARFDPLDPYSRHAVPPTAGWDRPRVGVPRPHQRETFGNAGYAAAFGAAIARVAELGWEIVEIDLDPFTDAGPLLYGSGLLAERVVSIGPWLAKAPDRISPTIAQTLRRGEAMDAASVHEAQQEVAELRRRSLAAWDVADVLLVPTAGTTFTVEEAAADPVACNAMLGHYTNFVNLFDLCAAAVPAGTTTDGFPFGVTFLGPAFADAAVADVGARFAGEVGSVPDGAGFVDLVVVGAHLRGQPLEPQLLGLGGRFVSEVRTAPTYRLYALDTVPPKPGLVRVAQGGAAIAGERWRLPVAGFGAFVAAVPAPLAIGTVLLDDGSSASGFLCEPAAIEGAADITATGGWRAHLSSTR